MACRHVQGYFMPTGLRILLIECLDCHFLCSCLRGFFFLFFYTQFHQIGVIFMQIYLTHKGDPNGCYHSSIIPRSILTQGIIAMNGYSTLPRFSELAPHHQMQYTVIPRTPLFVVKVVRNVLPLCHQGLEYAVWDKHE